MAVNRRRRAYRRNPISLAGLNLKELAFAAGGVIANTFIETQVRSLLTQMAPTVIAGASGRWIVRIGSAAATWQLSRMFFGRRISDVVAIALGANVLADIATENIPSLIPGVSGVGFYLPNPNLGRYAQSPGMGLIMPGRVDSRLSGYLPQGFTQPDRLAPNF